MNNSLESLIEAYGNLKDDEKELKERVNNYNIKLKKVLLEDSDVTCTVAENGTNKYSYSSENYTATYSVSVSENFDEQALLSVLVQLNNINDLNIIKLKSYIDMDALEDAIYNGKINAADLAKCKVRKEVPKLVIAKKKQSKDKK